MGAWESAENRQIVSDTELLSACRILFGPDVEITRDFLWYLQPEGAKSAYRRRARESHPDAHPRAGAERIRLLEDEFVQVSNAYQQLSSFLVQRPATSCCCNTYYYRQEKADGNAAKPETNRKRAATHASDQPFLYTGSVPQVELKIGRYLYFRGLVTFQSVMQALGWQREQRPSIGTLARAWGWLDDAAVHHILQSSQVTGRFGERAVKLGILSPWQCKELLCDQRLRQQRLGCYFMQRHGMTARILAQLEQERLLHNRQLRKC